jgi:hypothetical protein
MKFIFCCCLNLSIDKNPLAATISANMNVVLFLCKFMIVFDQKISLETNIKEKKRIYELQCVMFATTAIYVRWY